MSSTAGPQHPTTRRSCTNTACSSPSKRAHVETALRRALRIAPLTAIVATLNVGLVLGPRPVLAAPTAGAAGAELSSAQALESGDLTSARDLAVTAREADPTAANWAQEAEAATALGDYAHAIKAWKGHRDALPEDATPERASANATIDELRARSRGTLEDEPTSSHREELDEARAARLAALKPKPKPKPKKPPPPKQKVRIVKKWYFWLTVAALAASAGAITGIAVQAAREEDMDDLSARGGAAPTGPGGFVVRF